LWTQECTTHKTDAQNADEVEKVTVH